MALTNESKHALITIATGRLWAWVIKVKKKDAPTVQELTAKLIDGLIAEGRAVADFDEDDPVSDEVYDRITSAIDLATDLTANREEAVVFLAGVLGVGE